MQYELNENQLKNLFAFLNRVQLTGAEVPAYLELANILFKQEKPIEPNKE
jgi:hypothetical protein